MSLRERRAAGAEPPERAESTAEMVSVFRARLLAEIDMAELATLEPSQRRARLERVMSALVGREGPLLTTQQRAAIIRRVVDEALGLGVLEPLLADEDVTEIMVNGPQHVFVERAGRIMRVPITFASTEQLYQTIERIVSVVNRRVDESTPMVDARLPGGERVNVIIPPLALNGPTLTIRRFPKQYPINELVEKGSLDVATSLLLAACVRARLDLIVSGGTGSGKTTLLNALSAFIPDTERIVTIEDAAELSLMQEHVVRLESRPPNIEGTGQVTIRDLVRNSLRMRPDRIVVGEVRGGETLDMLQAMNTGHEGSLATVHANSADDAIVRLETLASMSELPIPYDTLRDQINNAIDVIVHLERGVDGTRRVVEVTAVASRRRESFRLATLVEFVPDPLGPTGEVTGRFVHHPLPRDLARRLMHRGESIPPAFGIAQTDLDVHVRDAL